MRILRLVILWSIECGSSCVDFIMYLVHFKLGKQLIVRNGVYTIMRDVGIHGEFYTLQNK
jgi:hypothetical protein